MLYGAGILVMYDIRRKHVYLREFGRHRFRLDPPIQSRSIPFVAQYAWGLFAAPKNCVARGQRVHYSSTHESAASGAAAT